MKPALDPRTVPGHPGADARWRRGFRTVAAAGHHWDAFPRSARRAILEWIGNARANSTRNARIERTVSDAARGIRANQWRC